MRIRVVVGACMATALLASCALSADALKSGPQPGDHLTPFEPQNVTGPFAGRKQCLV